MVCQVINAAAACGHGYQSPKGVRGTFQSFGTVNCVEVEDRTGVRLLCPREEALDIPLDKTHGSINQLGVVLAEIFAHFVEKTFEHQPGNVDLGYHLLGGIVRGSLASVTAWFL